MTKTNDDMIRELAILTTRGDRGHFTEWSQHYTKLEEMGLIHIDRFNDDGWLLFESQWTLTITEEGRSVVDANPELWPT